MKLLPIVGHSNSGKTTFLEKIIPEFKKRGYRLGVIKHDAHNFEIDREGKDSYRLKKAGADAVCISSPEKIGLVKNVDEDLSPDYLANDLFSDFDLVLTEGYKDFPVPKIEIFRSTVSKKPICSPNELVLLVTDNKLDFDSKQFSHDEIEAIVDYLEDNYIKKPNKKIRVRLTVDNKKVPLKFFIQDLMAQTLVGMVSVLKDIEDPKKIMLEIDYEK